jgi:serine/threonine-protein kinase
MSGPDRRGDELLGKSLGPYRVQYRLGAGATGVVFRAEETGSGRAVALKVLSESLGTIGALRGRFEREARLLARLDHPNIVHIAGFGVAEQSTYIAMELLEGRTLEQVLMDGPIDPRRGLEVVMELLAGLAVAHRAGIVHRDLKPANVFLLRPDPSEAGPGRPTDRVKLLDFGLAKLLSDEPSAEGEERTLTRKGRIVGTPAYMAPEQITGVALDVRADVYAIGILLFELLADRRPFASERRSELLRAHLLAAPPALHEAREGLDVHPQLEAVIRRALEKSPEARFPDAQAMLDALRALPRDPVRLVPADRGEPRSRSGASSEVISGAEREAISDSASAELRAAAAAPSPPERPSALPAAIRPPPAEGTAAAPVAEPRQARRGPFPRSVPTPVLYLVAALLFAAAAGIWIAVGPG